jgi:GNAT superfamily N-acetyltransferase
MKGEPLTTTGVLEMATLPPVAGDDVRLTSAIAGLVNDAYAVAGEGLWANGVRRTTAEQIALFTRARQVAVARVGGRIIGCVRVQQLAGGIGEFGMLAVDPSFRGMGVAREMVRFAEQVARKERYDVMQLEVLVPCNRLHSFTKFLTGWYTRIGYKPARTAAIEEYYPDLSRFLATPCYFIIHHKDLRGSMRAT